MPRQRNRLGLFETDMLLAVHAVQAKRGRCYFFDVKAEIELTTDFEPSNGALYTGLERLIEKKLVVKRRDEPRPIRGGRARHYYQLTQAGAQELRRTMTQIDNQLVVWKIYNR